MAHRDRGGLAPLAWRASPVKQVLDREVGMPQRHAGPGVVHHGAYLFPLASLEAVDGAVGTGGFVRAESTCRHATVGIVKQCSARWAECGAPGSAGRSGGVMIPAVHPDHDLDGTLLSPQSAGEQEGLGGPIHLSPILG